MQNELYINFFWFQFYMVVFIIIAKMVEWIFSTVHVYPKGLGVWVCKTNGEFKWCRNRLFGGTTNVCECLLLERGVIGMFI